MKMIFNVMQSNASITTLRRTTQI